MPRKSKGLVYGTVDTATDTVDKIFKKFDRLSSIAKLTIVGVSGYLVYRKYKSEVGLRLPPELVQRPAAGPSGATKPLAEPTAQVLPQSDPTQQVKRQTMTSEQQEVAQALPTQQAQMLLPQAIDQASEGLKSFLRTG